jgi:glycosyltransferase involved in cell wall biosynthesis
MRIINFGFNPWSQYWKRNQTIFYLLSKLEQVESALFANPGIWLYNILKMNGSYSSTESIFKLSQQISPKISVTTPIFYPFSAKSQIVNTINTYLNIKSLKLHDDDKILLILNDLQADLKLVDAAHKRAILTIFDWSDDFVEFSSNHEERRICEKRCEHYCTISDVILTINEDLKTRAQKINNNAHVVKNATNFFTFPDVVDGEIMSTNIHTKGRKVIGYVGWLNSFRLDLDLIRFIAEKRPEYLFVFIGPLSEKLPLGEEIPLMGNVQVLPPVPYREYPACLKALDVCMLPNLINAHTSGNDPIKIYDYLASGRPVVATKTAGTEVFADCLYLADDSNHFLMLLDQAVNEIPDVYIQERVEIARQHSWPERITEVINIINETTGINL